MKDLELAKQSRDVLINMSGMLRWATPSNEGGYNVQETTVGNKTYPEMHKYTATVVWNVAERGGYPDDGELAALQAIAK